jgi:hypothetical protein
MEATHWIVEHWLDLLQSVGIISGFVFTAHSIRKDSEARKIGNLIALADRHHSIWKEFHEHAALSRIKDERADLETKPLTNEETVFVTSIVIHLDSVRRAQKAKMFVRLEGLQKDVKEFFSLPIPKAVWEKVKPLQDAGFVVFMEDCLRA